MVGDERDKTEKKEGSLQVDDSNVRAKLSKEDRTNAVIIAIFN